MKGIKERVVLIFVFKCILFFDVILATNFDLLNFVYKGRDNVRFHLDNI